MSSEKSSARARASYQYRGFEVRPTERPSKNHRIGNMLKFWEVPGLVPRGDHIFVRTPLFQNRTRAERAIDTHLDGEFVLETCHGAAVVVDNPSRKDGVYRGARGTVIDVQLERGYGDRDSAVSATLRLESGQTVQLPTYAFKRAVTASEDP